MDPILERSGIRHGIATVDGLLRELEFTPQQSPTRAWQRYPWAVRSGGAKRSRRSGVRRLLPGLRFNSWIEFACAPTSGLPEFTVMSL